MDTPRDLARDTWERLKELVLLHAALEDYVLFTIAKVVSFSIGFGLGYYLWGI
tara:strand:+ start:3970 stop:4128 length:159 start_codon:yes stop_codon:yes gene_type:complete